jgi:acyl-coenzyme A thioesterase PaaI-like protein
MMHGGIISSILDGAMTHCLFAHGRTAVTAQLSTRFRHPVVTQEPATVSARIERSSHPLYILEARIVQARQIKATATGKFLDQPQLLTPRKMCNEQVCFHNDAH